MTNGSLTPSHTEKMKRSILQTEKECYICHTTANLHLHHVFYGTGNRKLSDQDGCVVYLCVDHHTGAHGIHTHRDLDLKLKRTMQTRWMEHYGKTVDDFIRRYGKNYL